ncbi:MAG: flagellar basal body rod protein FlgB [Melioribacteraceae bacterium]|jgi:flagellar basal-body rod protein FlgB
MPIPENKILENLLNFSALKQKVISQNLANSETFGYKRRDVAFKEILQSGMKTLSNEHLNNEDFEITLDESTENLSGINNVDVNKEMAEMAQNSIMFKFGAKKINSYYQTLQKVIRGGS